MNILDAFIKKHGQFILVIIGKPCTNKSYIAKEFANDLKLPIINMNKYYTDNKFVEKTVNDTSYKLYDHPDNINWDMVNSDVETKVGSGGGVVLYGNYIGSTKITFKPNFVLFVNMNNNLCKTILIKNKLLPYSPLSLTNEAPINPDVGPINPDVGPINPDVGPINPDITGQEKEEGEAVEDGDAEAVEDGDAEAVEDGDAEAGEEYKEPITTGQEGVREEGDEEEEDWEQTIEDSNTMERIGAEGDEPGVYNEDQEGGGGQGEQGEQDGVGGQEGNGGEEEEQLNNYFTNIFLPLYDEIITKVKINKFYNIKGDTKIDKIYDDMFDYLMALIEKDVSPPSKKEKKHDEKENGKEAGKRKGSRKGTLERESGKGKGTRER